MSRYSTRVPRFVQGSLWSSTSAILAGMCLIGIQAEPGRAAPCEIPDNGGGTIFLPPIGCGYLSPTDFHEIVNGLPSGSTIEIGAEHLPILCREQGGNCPPPALCPDGPCEMPGGTLGGFIERFPSELHLVLNGTGSLSGVIVDEHILMPLVKCETHTGPRVPGQPVQSFPADFRKLTGQGQGPNFQSLSITAGTDFGLPSPGHTTLTKLDNGNWSVDSFFDITYKIDFVGRNALAGHSGSTTGTIRMQVGQPVSSIDELFEISKVARLLDARPNPFGPATVIAFELETDGAVDLMVYDAAGRVVRHVVSRAFEAGLHQATWNGDDDAGNLVATGTYFTELRFNGHVADRKKATVMQ